MINAQQLILQEPLLQACLKHVESYRREKEKGAIAEGYVGLMLKSRKGHLDREPDFLGKRPDYEWTVAPQSPGSFRFIVEVVYLDSDDSAVDRVTRKVHKYRPLADHQYYVVAAVYEEGLNINEIQRPCMPSLSMKISMDLNTGEMGPTEAESIPQEYTTGHSSLLWLLPCPPNISEGSVSQTMTVAQIVSANAKDLHPDIFTRNLASTPGISLVS